jgi:hypothetical protein
MNIDLPLSITGFFRAHNSGQTEGLDLLFTDDAVVRDEEHEYRGVAIKAWLDNAIAQYKPSAEVTNFASEGDKKTVIAQVSGTFPGSPIQLRFQFTLRGDRIAALSIGA